MCIHQGAGPVVRKRVTIKRRELAGRGRRGGIRESGRGERENESSKSGNKEWDEVTEKSKGGGRKGRGGGMRKW